MLNQRDENLVQRCVDGELKPGERQELLTRMDGVPEGWKSLACAFMEEQLFGAAVAEAPNDSRTVATTSVRPAAKAASRRWFDHPLTSVVLSLSVAFLAGVLVAGRRSDSDDIDAVAADSSSQSTDDTASAVVAKVDSTIPRPIAQGELVADGVPYRMRLEGDGMTPREVPVYDDRSQFLEELERLRRERQSRGETGSQRFGINDDSSSIQFFKLRTKDGRTIVVPFEDSSLIFQ